MKTLLISIAVQKLQALEQRSAVIQRDADALQTEVRTLDPTQPPPPEIQARINAIREAHESFMRQAREVVSTLPLPSSVKDATMF